MSSAYGNGLHSSRNHFVEPPGITERLASSFSSTLKDTVNGLEPSIRAHTQSLLRSPTTFWKKPGKCQLRRVLNVTNLLIAFWVYTIWWGERLVFKHAIDSCDWTSWENWPIEATPHHLIFIADPQLVDPHTYPGRPWPLSSLTVTYTDQYMRRSYSYLQQALHPDSIYFLGDLFDGGREWATPKSISSSTEYRKYGDQFWLREYKRFGDLFFGHWNDGGSRPGIGQKGRRIIANLPGNHDLGFGNGIQEPVRARFNAYFGDGNQVDTIGNHTFVSVDAVSLSSLDQADPQTGSSGAGAGDGMSANGQIWKPVETFLEGVRNQKARAVERDLRDSHNVVSGDEQGVENPGLFSYTVTDLREAVHIPKDKTDRSQLYPTILLTHIPLYRAEGTPCGPLRERYPPSSDPPPDRDDRNAIALHAGYQYQNVLTPTVSRDLITKIGDVVQVYSGDDHDYCEVTHREYTGAVKEITVKSFSWAMGIDRPGFLMTSLWNPVSFDDNTSSTPTDTVQNHLCLLPNQLSIFTRYAYVLLFTIFALLIRAFIIAMGPRSPPAQSEPLLPLSRSDDKPSFPNRLSDASSTSSTSSSDARLAPRASSKPVATIIRSSSPSKFGSYGLGSSRPASPSKPGGDNFGPARHAHVAIADDAYDDFGMPKRKPPPPPPPRGWAGVWHVWTRSVRRVALMAGAWYLWLCWWG